METIMLFKAIQKHFLVFLIIVLFSVGCALALNKWLTPHYQAKATLISNSNAEDDRDSRYTSIMANQLLTKTYQDAIQSLYIANDVKSKLTTNFSALEILSKVKVRTDPTTLVIEIYVTSEDPREAMDIVNAFAQSFVDKSKDIISNANVTLLDLAVYENTSIAISPKKEYNIAICTFLGVIFGMIVSVFLEMRKKLKAAAQSKRYASFIAS